ncbi:MAG: YdeI/OmpD-associated family protein [Bacillota bacterium]
MEVLEFDAVIQSAGQTGGAYVLFPFDVYELFGTRGQVKIRCEFDGVPYRGSIANMGAGPCIGLLKSIRAQIGKGVGDTVHVRLWKDDEPRVVEVPADLRQALDDSPAAAEHFGKLSYTNKREYVQWITGAKRAATRTSRIEKAIALLEQGRRSPR